MSGLPVWPQVRHLDFRVYENGKPINPLTIKSQPQKTLKDGDLNRYEVVRDSVIRMLTLIPDVRQENTEIPVVQPFLKIMNQYNLLRFNR